MSRLPKARKEELVLQEVEGELLVYDLRSNQAHCLNETAALVFRRCDGQSTVAEVSAQLRARDAALDEEALTLALSELARAGLLEEPVGLSRREFTRRAGLAAALLPAVVTMLAPTAAEAASCRQVNQRCDNTSSAQCCAGLVCVNSRCVPA